MPMPRRLPAALLPLFLLAIDAAAEPATQPTPSSAAAKAPAVLAPRDVRVGDLAHELMLTRHTGGKIQMLLWIPAEFWEASMAQSGSTMPDKDAKAMLSTTRKYIIVMAIEASSSGDDMFDNVVGTEKMRELVRMVDVKGHRYAPIAPEDLDPRMGAMLGYVKPMFSQMMGKLGQGMQILAFPAQSPGGTPVADATARGRIAFEFDDERYDYRLPLGSLLVPKRDPASGEAFPGNYDYNPYTGAKLEPAPASK
ncbi:MAG: hypothetical protein ACTHOH_15955 [Lysobacteraceae bacterium]